MPVCYLVLRNLRRVFDGYCAASAVIACADTVGSTISFCSSHFGYACSNSDGAATAKITAIVTSTSANTGRIFTACSSDGSTADDNITTGATRRTSSTASDSSTTFSACSIDGSTADGNIAAISSVSATDAGTILSTSCGDCAALDLNIAASNIICATDAGTFA